MRNIIVILLFIPVILMGMGFDSNDKNKIEILRHFDIPASFLNDSSLHDVYSQKKRDDTLQGFDDTSDNAKMLLPMLSSLIAQSDLPNEFLYVVLAESQLDVVSTSSHGAAGLWQFMETTGKLQGLQINKYVDERRDHIKSTRAAIAYLSSLKKQFGKWYLALIAYNCGDGRLSRAIRKAGSTDLNVLADPKHSYIPQESRNYIRTVVALAFLGSEDPYLSQYTSMNDEVENPIATVYLPKGEKIDRIAAVLEMPKTNLVSLNTHLKKGITPPNEQSYPVYIPKEKLDEFREKFQPKDIHGYFIMHRIKSGETLDQISRRYNVPKSSIMMENMIGDNEGRNLNRRVKIPITKPFLKNPRLYTAKSGETLASVAALYNTTIEQLKLKNPFASSVLKEGEEIKVAD